MTQLPIASRPNMPAYGIADENSGNGLLPWSWAQDRLTAARFYWIGTTRPDGRPHSMPIWAVWVDDALVFSTGRQSRKYRNLQTNRNCVISVQAGDDSVIVEGAVADINDRSRVETLSALYNDKYKWTLDPDSQPVFMVEPQVVFGLPESDFTASATRWTFPSK